MFAYFRTIRRIILLFILGMLALSLVLTACTVGPDYKRPAFFSDRQVEQALDLKPDTPPIVITELPVFQDNTLKQLIETARRQSPTIRQALLRLKQARENLKITMVQGLPQLDAIGQYNYVKESRNMGYLTRQDYYQVGLDASWEIDIFGRLRRQSEAAAARAEGMIENLKNVFVSLDAEVGNAYVTLRMNEELHREARRNLKIQTDLRRLVQDKYETGLAGDIDLNQAAFLVQNTQAALPMYQQNMDTAKSRLALLLGQLPETLDELLAADKTNLVRLSPNYNWKKITALPVSILRNRPDVRIQEQALIAQNAEVGAAVAELFPTITLEGLLGFQALSYPRLWQHDSYGYSYVPKVNLPLFHFGAIRNNIRLQEEIKQEYLSLYEQALLNAAADVYQALSALKNERMRNRFARQAYENAKVAAELIRERYQSGLIPYSDVLDAEQRRLNAQNQMIESNATLYQNMLIFYKAVGGSFGTKNPRKN